jgi:ATP-dependent DNA helicase RecG
VPIGKLLPGEVVTVVGRIVAREARRSRGRGRTDLRARVADASGTLGVTWFGQGWLARSLPEGATVVLIGTLAPGPGRQFANPLFEVLPEDAVEQLAAGRIVPRYPLTAGVSGRALTGWVRRALDLLGEELAAGDPLPAEQARRRLALDELLVVQLLLALRRRAREDQEGGLVTARGVARARAAIAALPFTPTAAQKRAVNEIVADMKRPRAMHRLLVGDVGTGKTVVALLAAACAAEAGHQVAVMAPTEILADQHFRTLSALGRAAGLSIARWTGSTGERDRRELRRRLALPAGDPLGVDVLVGTHALLEAEVPLPRLGLVVVDEQHRFGVRQRAVLSTKGPGQPDVLVMTATPIPRTLALTFFGDLDVSVLDERPKDRLPILTRVLGEAKREEMYAYLARELALGRQVYVVVPLVEESETSDLRAAKAMVETLARHPVLTAWRWGLLHGRLKPAEKDAVMTAFTAGEIAGLVATTVIEVGVDVPNATVMVVEHAERFGLTQLHQLRGRVGRGSERSVCVLMAGPRAAPEAAARLALLAATDDGFRLAEEDLKARGAGELWGTRQTGLPALRVADLAQDVDLVEAARALAQAWIAADPTLEAPASASLRERLLRDFGEELSWRATG